MSCKASLLVLASCFWSLHKIWMRALLGTVFLVAGFPLSLVFMYYYHSLLVCKVSAEVSWKTCEHSCICYLFLFTFPFLFFLAVLGLCCGLQASLSLQCVGSSCGMQAWLSCGMWDPSFPTRDWTHVPCIGRQFLTTGLPVKFSPRPLSAFNSLSLSLIFSVLITVCLGMFLFGLILYGTLCPSWTWMTVCSPRLEKFSATISSNVFSAPFCLLFLGQL